MQESESNSANEFPDSRPTSSESRQPPHPLAVRFGNDDFMDMNQNQTRGSDTAPSFPGYAEIHVEEPRTRVTFEHPAFDEITSPPPKRRHPIIAFLTFFDGTMLHFSEWTEKRAWLHFIDYCFRGIAQVMIMDNPLSGVVMLAGLLLDSTWLAVAGALGLLSSTRTALVVQVSPATISSGLYGYNGFLVGCAVSNFIDGQFSPAGIVCALFASIFSTFQLACLSSFLGPLFNTPACTLPFNFSAMSFLSGIRMYNRLLLRSHAPFVVPSDDLGLNIVHGVFRGVAQVFFSGNTVTGAFIVAGMAICSGVSAVAVLVGSAVGLAYGAALGVDEGELYNGIWGFNPVLAVLAVGGIFYVISWRSAILAVLCGLSSCVLFAFGRTVFTQTGPMTLPFCVSAFFFIVSKVSMRAITPVPLSEASTPEAAWRARERLTAKHLEGFAPRPSPASAPSAAEPTGDEAERKNAFRVNPRGTTRNLREILVAQSPDRDDEAELETMRTRVTSPADAAMTRVDSLQVGGALGGGGIGRAIVSRDAQQRILAPRAPSLTDSTQRPVSPSRTMYRVHARGTTRNLREAVGMDSGTTG
eukprot:TRINITY_DN7367_c0_g1_i1.p1 TRINITY_DN7367_c0_g1~~TRINITY_DN7367_c0_g1_i1.p1  ORF type:complete len:585 (+),score=138.55 TRINITY_DN7367_c0_g1_i1:42-1796(+)